MAKLRLRHFEHVSDSTWGDTSYPKPNLPKRSTSFSAGYDIFITNGFKLEPGEEILIPTGFKVYMQADEFFMILPRSGQGFKFYARLANSVGIIDFDYCNNSKNEGHVFVKLRNDGHKPMEVKDGEAIAQGIFQKYLLVDDDDFNGNERVGGLGSTTK